jgi:hypothetical protein
MAQIDAVETIYDYPLITRDRVESYLLPLLASTEKGSDVDLRSPLYKADREDPPQREVILSLWDELVHLDKLTPVLAEAEREQLSKVGPYSVRLPFGAEGGLGENVAKYFDPKPLQPNSWALDRATSMVESLVQRGRLRPTTIESAVQRAPKSTNWGLPYMKKGSGSASQYAAISKEIIHGNYSLTWPSLLGWRGQATGLDSAPKQRVVWMFPHSTTLIESTFLYPVLNILNQSSSFAGWRTSDYVDAAITDMMKTGLPLISFDASSFDSTISKELIERVYSCLRLWFQPEYSKLLTWMEDQFKATGIITPKGIMNGREGAVPSGSGLTNLVDSLVNVMLYYYVGFALDAGPKSQLVTVLGDDAVWAYQDSTVDMEILEKTLKPLNITANPDKQYRSPDVVKYLQNVFERQSNGGEVKGVRPSYRVLSGAMSYERFHRGWNAEMDSLRWIMQLENARNHPNFKELVNFVKNGDKLALGLNSPGGVEGIFRRNLVTSKSALGLESFQHNRPDIEGWRAFDTVKVLNAE